MDRTPQDYTIAELRNRQQSLHTKIDQLREECSQLNSAIQQLKPKTAEPQSSTKKAIPPPLPQPVKKEASSTTGKCSLSVGSNQTTAPSHTEKTSKAEFTPQPAKTPSPSGDWEMKLGKIWFVRFGILSLLTGLIFLGNYAYHNWFFAATAPVKLSCFMLISLVLSFGGMLFEKKKKDLRHYGRVITSGGLAAGYYSIYASHFVPSLKVVNSPPLAATLLTLWAGVMLAYACWKRSRTISIMAIGLAFYGTIVNPTGWLSLFSALLLSSSGIYLLVRYRWTSVGIITVAAAYISHAFWLGLYPHTATDSVRISYLACYWLLFIAALAVPASKNIQSNITKLIATISNSGTWLLTVYSIPSFYPQDYLGEFSIGFGSFLIICGALSNTGKLWPKHLTSVFTYQGLFLLTIGIIDTYAGHTRYLILAAEACLIMAAGMKNNHQITKAISAVVYLISLGLCLFDSFPPAGIPVYLALTILSGIYSILTRYAIKDDGQTNNSSLAVIPAALTWLILSFGVYNQFPDSQRGIALLATLLAIVLLHFKVPRLGILQDLALTTPVPLLITAVWILISPHDAAFLSYLSIAGFIGYWVLSPSIHQLSKDTFGYHSMLPPAKDSPIGWISGMLTFLVTLGTLHILYTSHLSRALLPCIVAIAYHIISEKSKRPSLSHPALFGILFSLAYLTDHASMLGNRGLIVVIAIGIHLVLADFWLTSINRKWLRSTLALGMILTIIPLQSHIPHPYYIYTALAVIFYFWGLIRKDTPFLTLGTIIPFAIAQTLNLKFYGDSSLSTYLCLGVALAIHPLTKNISRLFRALHSISALFTLTMLFLAASIDVISAYHGQGLSIAWTLLAFFIFSLGLVMKYRLYRYTGLVWLGLAAIYIMCIDVIRFDTLGRILSFIVLGLTLIFLGYLYNRFQENIKKLL